MRGHFRACLPHILTKHSTTRAPSLNPDHPLRRMLTRYGTGIARNVATTLLIFVAISTTLLYPIPFLYTSDFASGASNLPHHVWTNAQPIKGALAVEPDVIMRSIWVHGSYMKALDRKVLLSALELQDTLLGPTSDFAPRRPSNTISVADPSRDLTVTERDTFHVVNGLTNQSWFFHSPLLYWLSDCDIIANDTDILSTVNEHKKQHTSVNVTLRHSVVFSGKRFEDRALVAADALVITLIYLRDSPVGRQWERKTAELATHVTDKFDIYPKRNPHNLSSQLYEFQFLPISWQDSLMLALAYGVTFIYVIQNLSKLPAIKSRPGLILTVVAQIFVSIMSSFTVCAVLKIDLSHIPRAAYPIVIVSMSLENMLRLIKGVIATNLEDSTSNRIGVAFGKTTHVAFAGVMEHIVLLWGISKLVTSGLSDFCAFLAIAVVFDFFYLSTFFVAVLSCEVRRSELSEIIEKTSSTRRSKQSNSGDPMYYPHSYQSLGMPTNTAPPRPPRPSWVAAMLQGRADASTRIAGTIILLGFVVIAQWHFFENEGMTQTFRRLVVPGSGGLIGGSNNLTAWNSGSTLHQARSPASWLRIQDHETAQEVINVIKPLAHSYVARVYEPLVFVLKGSDRMPSVAERPFLPAVYDFIRHQSQPFILTIVVLTAAMRIFVNFLLWDEMGEASDDSDTTDSLLSVKTLDQGHALDVALMAASPDGLVVSVGLDRWIRVWNVPFGGMSYLLSSQDVPSDVPFPVLALAIDEDSAWLAILSSYQVMLWNLEGKQWGPSIAIDLCGQKPEAFFFTPNQKSPSMHSLVVVRRNGTLVELWAETGETVNFPICKSPLVCAIPLHASATDNGTSTFSIITASRNGCVHRVTPVGGDGWISQEIKNQARTNGEHATSLVGIPRFSVYLVARRSSVDLVDLETSQILHTFMPVSPIKSRTLRYLCSARRQQTQRGSPELSYFSLVYNSSVSGNCVLQTYLPKDENGSIMLVPDEPSTSGTGCSWYEARLAIQEVPKPGVWEALPNGCVIGVRQTDDGASDSNLKSKSAKSATGVNAVTTGTGSFRRRGLHVLASMDAATSAPAQKAHGRSTWETWSISSVIDHGIGGDDDDDEDGDGDGNYGRDATVDSTTAATNKNYVVRPLGMDQGELLVTEPGPVVCVGAGTVALGLGAAIKIITMGHERYGSPADMLEAAAGQMANSVGNRRRKNRSVQRH